MSTVVQQLTVTVAEGGDDLHAFNGLPQPSVNERLQESKIFLADEDVNRCLGFKSKLSQIEEYVKYVEENEKAYDLNLLQDVQTMAEVHREWMERFMDAPPCDKNVCDPLPILPFSSRLVSTETAQILQEEREAMGLSQMRDDHAPFTVDREDQVDFLEAMTKDASRNPETVNEKTNLLWVENRAYGWALREPSLIPLWMHPRLGLPNKGIKASDEVPWYRRGVVPVTKPPVEGKGPDPQQLPDAQKNARSVKGQGSVDFSGKAERRGVQRAAIELALNLLATNQEQHRPHDRFRRVQLPLKFQPPLKEVPLWKPLEPWKRPVELDTFEFTKLMLAFRKWTDDDYRVARDRAINWWPGQLQAPVNYNGPFTVTSLHDLQEIARKRQNYLAQIHARLLQTQQVAPRPLLERICILMGEAIIPDPGQGRPLLDDVALKIEDLEILTEFCDPSWNLEWRPYDESISGLPEHEPDRTQERRRLEEFEGDVERLEYPPLPLWQPPSILQPGQRNNPNAVKFFGQTAYDSEMASQNGLALNELVHNRINTARGTRAGNTRVHLWTTAEAIKYLRVMHNAGRIHFDATPGQERVSRIPLTGHPENKYVSSREEARRTPFIHFNEESKKFEVQIDHTGRIGTPIVQPNKYEYLQRLASRVGRDIRILSNKIARGHDDKTRFREQMTALQLTLNHMGLINHQHIKKPTTGVVDIEPVNIPNGKEISLQKIARDLIKVAPDLAQEANLDFWTRDLSTMTEVEAAKLIQMQIIEESNNNWESRFPENEHVWDWVPETTKTDCRASDVTKQYFSMRKWPVCCQSDEVQAFIKTSMPMLPEGPEPANPITQSIAEKARDDIWKPQWTREQHTGKGGPPYFPFGETPYQQAYLSWRMEHDLKDVEEFKTKPLPNSIFSALKRKAPDEPLFDRFALPEIPAGWNPDNVSIEEKRIDIIARAKKTNGFPKIDEAYYTPAEITARKLQNERIEAARLSEEAAVALEERSKQYSALNLPKIPRFQLNIDPVSDQVALGASILVNPSTATHQGRIADVATPMAGGLGGFGETMRTDFGISRPGGWNQNVRSQSPPKGGPKAAPATESPTTPTTGNQTPPTSVNETPTTATSSDGAPRRLRRVPTLQ